jgi:hypothetical protein
LEEAFEKSNQLKKLVLSYEYTAPTQSHQITRDDEAAQQQNLAKIY